MKLGIFRATNGAFGNIDSMTLCGFTKCATEMAIHPDPGTNIN